MAKFSCQPGSSHGESRIIRRTYPEDHYTALMPLAYDLWSEAAAVAGFSPVTITGGLDIGPADNKDLQAVREAASRHGVPHEVLSAAEMEERFPFLRVKASPEQREEDGRRLGGQQETSGRVPVERAECMGLYSPDAGVVNASKAVAMFLQLAAKHGAAMRDRSPVSGIEAVEGDGSEAEGRSEGAGSEGEKGGPHLRHATSEGADGGVAGMQAWRQRARLVVRLEGGEVVKCSGCVVAAGAWTGHLVKASTGVELPLQAVQTTVAEWPLKGVAERKREGEEEEEEEGEKEQQQRAAACLRDRLPVFISYDEHYIYGMPGIEYPGLVKICLHSGEPCDPARRSLAPQGAPTRGVIGPWVRQRFGGLLGDQPVMMESCLYTMTPDQDFIIDRVPLRKRAGVAPSAGSQASSASPPACVPGIVVAAGFSGHGFKFGPLIGKIAADMATEGCSSVPYLNFFSVGRFAVNARGNLKECGPQVR